MKRLQGIVTNDKMTKTAVVKVTGWKIHRVYKKRTKQDKKYHAENTIGAKIGDRIMLEQTRPLSKTKKWRVAEVIK